MIRCVIVDDEPLAVSILESYVNKTPSLELVGSFTNAFEALSFLQTEKVDLLFLDIQMPEITGLELAASIDAFTTKIIFTTAFNQYALEGFRVDALDYLLKPISYPHFLKAVKKVQRYSEAKSETDLFLIVKSDYRVLKISYSDILYIESLRDYVLIALEDGCEIKTLSTLKAIESNISSPPFYRVHRSFLVNLVKVKVMERNCIVFGKKLIPISESYREAILNIIQM
ncbi:MAG: LytR/AlgR family response regulator transcription factor [Bacteroidales bacterium]